MSEDFAQVVERLVAKCEGNRTEAARRAGLSPPMISRTLRGEGPQDPHTETWRKVYTALGETMPHRGRAVAPNPADGPVDRFDALGRWIADFTRANPDKYEAFAQIAKAFGRTDD